MNNMFNGGVKIQVDDCSYIVKLSITSGIADLPAKAELLNMSNFNGSNDYIICEDPGLTVRQGKGTARCFPHKIQGNRSEARTHNSAIEHMRQVLPGIDPKVLKGFLAYSIYNAIT